MITRRALLLAGALAPGLASRAAAQGPLVVTVRTAERQPLAGAVVSARAANLAAATDRLGRARFSRLPRPDTIVVLYVGFVPDTVAVAEQDTLVSVVLTARTPTLSDLTIYGGAEELTPASSGRFVVPRQMIFETPAAVEPDPLRALALIPSVNFSSPLSARPLLRGYDADESIIRLDGYELTSPYHIARAFSAVPADAIERVAVAPSAGHASVGETLAGVVDLEGRMAGTNQGNRAGIALSPVSATGFASGPPSVPLFAAGRLGFLERFTDLLGDAVPYSFRDGYLRVRMPGSSAVDATAYGSHDEVGQPGNGEGMTWSSLLLGGRLRLADRAAWSADLHASWNAFTMTGNSLPVRGSTVDVGNEISRATIGATLGLGASRSWQAGAALTVRHAVTTVTRLTGNDEFPADADEELEEAQAWLQGTARWGAATIEAGARIDASSRATALQPRVRVRAPLSASLSGSLGYARTGRLFYLLSDPAPEPQLIFPQFWLTAGDSGTGTPVVDHLTAGLDWHAGTWQLSGALYGSLGRDIGELRPSADAAPGASAFRFGDSRTAGAEVRLAHGGAGRLAPQVSVSYVLSVSERRWEDGQWRPWRLDRRHLARLQASAAPGRFLLFMTVEAQSGQPLTRVQEVIRIDPPPVDATPAPGAGSLAYRYDEENSSRSAGTLRFDIGALLRTRGPWGSRFVMSASVINAGAGPVAPDQPMPPGRVAMLPPAQRSAGVPYERAFNLPAVPTLTLRLEF